MAGLQAVSKLVKQPAPVRSSKAAAWAVLVTTGGTQEKLLLAAVHGASKGDWIFLQDHA